MEELEKNDPILEELQTTEDVRSWYTTWWGVLLIVFLLSILGAVAFFINKIDFFRTALEAGNHSAFEGIYIDASEYSKVGHQVSRAEVETPDDPFWGNPDAELVIVEFGDFGCPYCRQNAPMIGELRKKYSADVKFIYRDMPLTFIHPEALIAAQASECADDQNAFWSYHDLLYEQQGQYSSNEDLIGYAEQLGLESDEFRKCLVNEKYKGEALNDMQEGIRFGVKGTPTFFVNGLRLSGVVTYDTFSEIIDRYLERL